MLLLGRMTDDELIARLQIAGVEFRPEWQSRDSVSGSTTQPDTLQQSSSSARLALTAACCSGDFRVR